LTAVQCGIVCRSEAKNPFLGETSETDLPGPSAPPSIAAHRDPVEAQRTPPASESYRISRSILAAGGGVKTSASFAMNGTHGQSTDLARRESAAYVLVPGYWGRWYPVLKLDLYLPLVFRNY
ncbi:MAG: hypothetical protein JW900_05355, partial [Anaerolineae bacterium]|nr:hypothetical protein [Anaerolineae bacterium]